MKLWLWNVVWIWSYYVTYYDFFHCFRWHNGCVYVDWSDEYYGNEVVIIMILYDYMWLELSDIAWFWDICHLILDDDLIIVIWYCMWYFVLMWVIRWRSCANVIWLCIDVYEFLCAMYHGISAIWCLIYMILQLCDISALQYFSYIFLHVFITVIWGQINYLSRGVYGIAHHDIILFLHVFIRISFKFLFICVVPYVLSNYSFCLM